MSIDWGTLDDYDMSPSPRNVEEKKPDWQVLFVKALKAQDYGGVTEALKNGADPEVTIQIPNDYETTVYQTALFYALYSKKDTRLMDVLVAGGADVNAVDGNKRSLLRSAVGRGYTALALHVAKYETLDFRAGGSQSAYELAAEKRHKEPQMESVYRYLHMKMEELKGPWRKTADDSIKYVSYDNDGMTEISETFNFRAAKQSRMIRDFDTKAVLTTETYFADIPANAQSFVREAFDELKKAGGAVKIDPHMPSNMRRYVSRKR